MHENSPIPQPSSEAKRGHILISCPSCGSSQSEPKTFVSTFCKSCGTHFEEKSLHSDRTSISPQLERIQNLAKKGGQTEEEADLPPPTPPSVVERLQLKPTTAPKREIICIKCAHEYTTAATSENCLCPQCGTYLALGDLEIRTTRNSNIETGGDVTVHKEGILQCSSVSCHHLTIVDGTYRGRVHCTGRFHFRGHAKILGSIDCQELIIEEDSSITCFQTVRSGEATILGELNANLVCKGTVRIGNMGVLEGDVVGGAVRIDPGGSLNGNMEIRN